LVISAHLGTNLRWALAALAGLLNGVGFVFWGPMTLVANVPLLLALRASPSATECAGLGVLVGFIGGIHIYGIVDYGWFLLLGFSLYTASQMVVYGLLFRALWGKGSALVDVLLPAAIWGLTEWMRTAGPLSMPASYVGNLVDTPALRPWLSLVPITGGLGLSTLAALVQSILFHALIGGRAYRRALIATVALIAGVGVWGGVYPPALGEKPVRVAGIQGGLANDQYWVAQADPAMMRQVVRTFETLTQQAYADGADLVVWPETAVRVPVTRVADLQRRLYPPATSKSTLIAGLIDEDRDGRRYNAALGIGPGGARLGRYAKVRLVPGTEGHFTAGKSWAPIETAHGPVGVFICLESVYPDAGRALARAGAELLVVMSNDAGFGRSPITQHMTSRASVRALETGRWLLRVGQAGITTLIDPRGQARQRLGLFEPGVLTGTAMRRSDLTLYVAWGDWWVAVLLFILGWATTRRLRERGGA
jgi:apolipoprotein N-acyltransferase